MSSDKVKYETVTIGSKGRLSISRDDIIKAMTDDTLIKVFETESGIRMFPDFNEIAMMAQEICNRGYKIERGTLGPYVVRNTE